MKKTKKQVNILHHLTCLFFIMVLPIMVAGIFFQVQANRSIQSNILSSVSSRIANNVTQIDQSFASSNQLASFILSDTKVQRIANPRDPMTTYDRTVNVNYVRSLLYSVKLSNPYANNVRLYLPEMGVYYNANNAYNYETNRNYGSQGTLTDSMYGELISIIESTAQVHIMDGQMGFLQYSSRHNPRILIETIYVIPELKDMFSETLLYDNSIYYFSLSYCDYTVTNCADAELLPAISELSSKPFSKISIQGEKYYVFHAALSEVDGHYLQFIPADELFMNMELSAKYSIIFTITVLFCCLIFIIGAFKIIHTPVKELTAGLKEIEKNNFNVHLDDPDTSDFQYLYESFNHMSARLYHLIQQELQHEILLNQAQLKQLQAQINPHFLYNSFFMLNQMITREMNDEAKELSKELGSYFKYITRNYKDEVSLFDEYEHTRMYASIQAKRFTGRIRIAMDEIPPAFRSLAMPKLILQPILENSFKYGMEEKIRDGLVRMTFQTGEDSVRILIDDNGDCLSDETLYALQDNLKQASFNSLHKEATGLLNIYKRLQLYYGRSDVMSVSRSSLGGLQVCITLYKQEVPNVSTFNR